MLLFTVVELIFFTLSALKIIKFFVRFCAVLEIVFLQFICSSFCQNVCIALFISADPGIKNPVKDGAYK